MKKPPFGHGRLPSLDPRNADFPAKLILGAAGPLPIPRRKTLDLRWQGDQGDSSKCVGYTGEAFLKTSPKKWGVAKLDHNGCYQGAQLYDEWPGEGYDGSSILGLCKFLKDYHPAKDVQSYYWAKTVNEIVRWIGSKHGTAVPVGTNWYESMYDISDSGVVSVEGYVSSGHAYICIGYDLVKELLLFQNSWKLGWSPLRMCRFYISFRHFQRLLNEDGEAALVTKF